MNYSLKSWALGLLNAFISGGASSIVVGYIDPQKFNFTHAGLLNFGELYLVAGVISLAKFLLQFGVPGALGAPQPSANSNAQGSGSGSQVPGAK